MKEFIKSLLNPVEERVKNPIIGAFIISFIAFNWKSILVILFYNQINIFERICLVEIVYTSSWNYIIPLISTIVYNLGLPYVNWLSHKIKQKPIQKINEINIEIVKGKIEYREKMIENKTNEVLQEINLQLEEKILSIEEEKTALNNRILNIEEESKKLERENENLKKIIEYKDNSIDVWSDGNNSFKKKTVRFFNGTSVLIEKNKNGTLSYHELVHDRPITKAEYYLLVSDVGIQNEQIIE